MFSQVTSIQLNKQNIIIFKTPLFRKVSETDFVSVVVTGSFLAVAETAAAEVEAVAVVETAVEFVVSALVELTVCVCCSLRTQHEI